MLGLLFKQQPKHAHCKGRQTASPHRYGSETAAPNAITVVLALNQSQRAQLRDMPRNADLCPPRLKRRAKQLAPSAMRWQLGTLDNCGVDLTQTLLIPPVLGATAARLQGCT